MLGSSNGGAGPFRLYARHALTIVVVLLVAACTGGGCTSGCSGCGLTTLTTPIATADLIENAGSARVTRSGLDFLAASAPTLAGKLLTLGTGGEYQYPINQTMTSTLSATICTTAPDATSNPEECTADIELGQALFHVDAVTPDAIVVSGTLPVRVEDLPVSATEGITLSVHVGLGTSSGCSNDGTPNESYYPFPFSITLPLVADTIAPRVGFTKIDAANVVVNVSIGEDQVALCGNCGSASILCDPLLSGIKDLAFSTLSGDVTSALTSAIQAQLCTTPDATGACPAGSAKDATTGNCDYTAQPGTCLPIGLGVEGGLNFGSLLKNISYGTESNLNLALASGGTMIPANAPTSLTGSVADNVGYSGHTPNGMTLGLLGALVPSPISACAPQAPNPIPTDIPIPVELEQNKETPWSATDTTGPQIGLALAGRFLNYALASVYNSGGLCLGITTDTFPQLDTGLLSILAPSIKDLTFEQGNAAVAVTTRPQTAPTVVIGDGTDPNTDPLLMVSLKQFALDFYVWSDDRFIRAFTFTADLTIPVNLSTAVSPQNPDGELLPTLGTALATNGIVTNSEALTDDPAKIATGLTGLVGGIVGQVAGSLKPVSLASLTGSFGISLTIPDGGIRKLTSGTDDFVALFGDMALAPAAQVKVHPKAKLLSKDVHPEAMTLATYDRAKLPALHLAFGTDGGSAPVEYTYWIDQGTRSPWSTATDVTVQNQTLFLQGEHVLYVSARELGAPLTETDDPVAVPYVIDVLPPTITLTTTATGASLTAWDYVSDQAHLEARTRMTDSTGAERAWSDWQPLASFANIAAAPSGSSLAAEVRDQEGNVASSDVWLIRGQNDVASAAGACGCSTPGTNTRLGRGGSLLLAGLALGLIVLARRRTMTARAARAPRARPLRPVGVRGATVVAATALGLGVVSGALSQGCSCGGTTSYGEPDGGNPKSDAGDAGMTGCGSNCNMPCMAALPQGIIGAYTSIAKASDGTVWVAGYDDSAVTQGFMGLYGDLVVGKYDSTKNLVSWTTVDGVPDAGAGSCPLYEPTGWRQGQSASGPDVGLWTSIQLDANDHPIVSYYDATDQALKFASSIDGVKWTSHTVMQAVNSDIGRYSKMLVVGDVPVIAFLIMEPGSNGKLRSRVELATGKTATPTAASGWSFEDAAVDDDGPCRPAFCTAPSVCIKETGECSVPSTACTGADGGTGCASTLVCVGGFDGGPGCGTQLASTYIDIYPNAFGDYIAMAKAPATSNGVGIIVYDRIHGALVQLAKTGGTWQETVLDSETGARAPNPGPDGGITPAETGDVGVGASLFITDSGDWHVSYVNGTTEALQYILVPGGTQQPKAPEIVDDGTMLAGAPFPDGQHIVGDDSSIQVDSMGNVTISYQDATALTLRIATGTPGSATGDPHTWAVLAASQPNKLAGFFSHSFVGDPSSFANHWRTTDQATGDESGDVSFVSP